MNEKDFSMIELTQESIKTMVYEVRGQRVMVDSDLAMIYGYTTKAFNQQIKNNIQRFETDFMFKLKKDELEELVRSKKLTTRIKGEGNKGGRRTLPYVFTEQGIYMLMTVLKGELAVQQSKTLIRLFKTMKDYIAESNSVGNLDEIIRITNTVAKHERDIETIKDKIEVVMDNFIDPSKYKHFLIMDGQKAEADITFQSIYSLAHESICLIDNYIDIKTLYLLKCVNPHIKITIFSDNKASNSLNQSFIKDFSFDREHVIFKSLNNRFHDRYIIVDYKTNSERMFHCGSSSKDAGNKITTITEIECPEIYHNLLDELPKNADLLFK